MSSRLRASAVALAIALAGAGCNVAVAPPAGAPAAPGASAAAKPASAAPTPDLGPDRPEGWLDGQPPLLADQNGNVPRVVAWTRLAPADGVTVVMPRGGAAGDVQWGPDPADVQVTLAAPPGSPGTTITAYEVVYQGLSPGAQAAGQAPQQIGPIRVPIAPLQVPPGLNGRAGAPATVDVALGNRQVVETLFPGAGREPTMVLATIAFLDDAGMTVSNPDLDMARAVVPIRGVYDVPPQTPARAPAPALPSLAPGSDPGPVVVALAGVVPDQGLKLTKGGWGQPPELYFVTPPGATRALLAGYELAYSYQTPKRLAAAQPPFLVGPVRVSLPPQVVRSDVPLRLPIPLRVAPLEALLDAAPEDRPDIVDAQLTFFDLNGTTLQGPDMKELKATIRLYAK